jgi:SAM-dependent methyltransferase
LWHQQRSSIFGEVPQWLAKVTPGRGTFLDPIRYADGYTPARFTAQSLEQCRRVLVVGDAGGRDSYYLSHFGHDIVQLDLAAQDDVPDLVVQSIEDPTPFADAEFDGVVLNEVIEHLYRDLDALREVHRILRPGGVLVVSVPTSRRQDRPPWHLRIHTQRTLTRLLGAAGFTVTEEYFRGIVARLAATLIGHVTGLAAQVFLVRRGNTPEAAIHKVNGPLARLEYFIGSKAPVVQRPWITYGLHVAAVPAKPIDGMAIQVSEFAQTNRLRHTSSGSE